MMKLLKRAFLYIWRKRSRSILLLLLLTVLAISISIGITVWNSLDSVVYEVQNRLGTSFIVKMQDGLTAGPFEMVKLRNGGEQQTYVGPRVDQQMVDQIMQADGISFYQAENFTYACVDGINLIAGGWVSGL